MHARFLGEALDAAAGDNVRAARFLDEAARAEIGPFYRASGTADGHASRQVGAVRSTVLHRCYDSFFEDGVIPATRVDSIVFRAFVRMMNMLETPERAFFRPEIVERVVAVWMRGPAFRRRYAPTVPDRERTIAALEAVVRGAGRQAALA